MAASGTQTHAQLTTGLSYNTENEFTQEKVRTAVSSMSRPLLQGENREHGAGLITRLGAVVSTSSQTGVNAAVHGQPLL